MSVTSFPAIEGDGANQELYGSTIAPITAQIRAIRWGSNSAPDTESRPLFKVSRTTQVTRAAVEALQGTGADGAEQLAAIYGIGAGTAATEVQPVGVLGAAKTASTTGVTGNDACGVYGVGRALGAGANGTGIGIFAVGRRDVDTARANAAELDVANYTATPGVLNTGGFSDTTGLWINALGNSDSAVGIAISNAFGRRFGTGILATSQGTTGGVRDEFIRDESQATTSVRIRGTHTAAVTVNAGAGPVWIGRETALAGGLLEVYNNASSDPVAAFSTNLGSQACSARVGNGSGSVKLAISGSADGFVKGSIAGDAAIPFTPGKTLHVGVQDGTTTGTVAAIKVSSSGASSPFTPLLGFHGATPVAKPTVSGSKGANAALTSLMTALSSYGLVTDSTT